MKEFSITPYTDFSEQLNSGECSPPPKKNCIKELKTSLTLQDDCKNPRFDEELSNPFLHQYMDFESVVSNRRRSVSLSKCPLTFSQSIPVEFYSEKIELLDNVFYGEFY
jgi:hypothetical protein